VRATADGRTRLRGVEFLVTGNLLGPGRARYLRAIPLFSTSSDAELALVEELVDDVEVDAGEVLDHPEEGPIRSYVVVSGEAVAAAPGQPPRTISAGATFGLMARDGRLRNATVTATTPMRLLVLDRERLRAFVERGGLARRVLPWSR